MTAITKEKIAELRAVSYAATPTPWRVQTDAIGGIHKGTVNIEECGRAIETVATYCGAYEGHGKSNADFIVAAVNALPELLDEIERLRANNVQAWAECERQRFLAGDADIYRALNAELRQACRAALSFLEPVMVSSGFTIGGVVEELKKALGEK